MDAPPRRIWPKTICNLALVVVLAACSTAPGQAAGTPVDLTDSSLIPGAYANPLDPIMFPDETQQNAINGAGEAMVTECVTDRGFTYQTGAVFPRRRGAADAQYTYSVTDPEVAAVYGFHPATWVEEMQNAPTGPTAAWPEGYEEALFGQADRMQVKDDDGTVIATYDPDSCSGRAKDTITPGWAQQERLLNVAYDVLYQNLDKVETHPDVLAGFDAWSACMAEAGYTYDTPMAANEAFATDLPTADEISVAVASATCMHSSGLLRTWSKVRTEITQAELDKHPGLVTEWLDLQQQAVANVSGS